MLCDLIDFFFMLLPHTAHMKNSPGFLTFSWILESFEEVGIGIEDTCISWGWSGIGEIEAGSFIPFQPFWLTGSRMTEGGDSAPGFSVIFNDSRGESIGL